MKQFQNKKFALIGFGSIGRALTECLVVNHGVNLNQFSVVVADEISHHAGRVYGLNICNRRVTKDNYQDILESFQLKKGDVLINVALDVCSKDVLTWCMARGIHYLDTWLDAWTTPVCANGEVEIYENWPLRQEILKDRPRSGPTSVICHGANPGIVSHFIEEGLRALASRLHVQIDESEDLSKLSQRLGVCAIQIAESDTQHTADPQVCDGKTIYSTWAPDSLATEAKQCSEIAWGTHEESIPSGWTKAYPESTALVSDKPGLANKAYTWTPCNPLVGFILPHYEAFSIADRLSIVKDDKIVYRPTVYYVYRPANDAWFSIHEWAKNSYPKIEKSVLMNEDLVGGHDSLGLLFILNDCAYWYGSLVQLDNARLNNPNMNATSSQVVGAIIGALAWMFDHPNQGIVEPEEMDSDEVMKVARPYLGSVFGEFSSWGFKTPEHLQFSNFLFKGSE